ncbi:TetR/AcrR family transcriptional regulator [Pseudomonas sp. R5(2019)]|uniref:TetR/AcrR family transcriptional regulator n=1 Tax=Pseudomonas sp. R5(2019) TaxID=2697566 RepID=UPI001411D914|nr:TetR/AcrR family transcriptional regulator [Pseudomonas sp. R5(2019)]NBA96040.1 TetR family transcriptional regulator [Pseudomonas sp. R5(2019)]
MIQIIIYAATVHGEMELSTGLRERNKTAKRSAIMAAARKAFAEIGFEMARLRDIAASAGVATGTVFLYAKTKEELLLLVFEEELEPLINAGFETLPSDGLQRQLRTIFDVVADHHEQNFSLCRHFLKEILYLDGACRVELKRFIRSWIERIAKLIDEAKTKGEISDHVNADHLAELVLGIFMLVMRDWLNGNLARQEMNSKYDSFIHMLFSGLEPGGFTVGSNPKQV